MREDYIKELFNYKNKFVKKVEGKTTSADKQDAYQKLVEIISRFIAKTVRLEKNKHMRERLYYQRAN